LLENDFRKYLKKVKGTTVYYDLNIAKKAFNPKAQSVKKKAKSTTKERDNSSNDKEDKEIMF
jgi:hypothetical protein